MFEEAEKKRMGEKIENLKDKYNKYELGEIKADELKALIKNVIYLLTQDFKIEKPEVIDKFLNPNYLEKTKFSSFVKTISEASKPEVRLHTDSSNRFPRYKKKDTKPISDFNDDVKKMTSDFVTRNLGVNEFRQFLSNNGFNPNVEAVIYYYLDQQIYKAS